MNQADLGGICLCDMFPYRFACLGSLMFDARLTAIRGRALTAASVLLVTLGLGGAARADSFSGVYSVSLIGLSLGTATVSGKISGNDYKIEAYANLTGLASAMTGAKGSAVASGALQNGQLAPNAYATTSSNSKETRTVRIGMAGGTVKAVDIQPPFDQLEGRVPLTDAHKRGIVDPLSALIMPVSGNLSDGPTVCRRSIPVFDGYTRFNVDLAYTGTRQVASQGYNGPVIVCGARYKPIAGHRPGRRATQFMVDNKDMEVWLAPLAGAKAVVPFRIAVRTMVGMTVIEARKFNISSDAPATAGTPASAAQR